MIGFVSKSMLVSFRMGVCGMIGDVDVDTHTYNFIPCATAAKS